ncbi:MAG: peptidoglycan DD-metalloendopeptidase family protein [Methylotenera sp.]
MYSGKFLMIGNSYKLVLFTLLLSLSSCSSNPPAPVVDRLPSNKTTPDNSGVAKTPAKPITGRPTYKTGDWRPDTYIVKKGDTLFSIGLEHGYDYKEIAQANNIPEPYHIRIGQSLKLSALKDKPAATESTASQANSDGVLITPINTEPSAAATNSSASTPSKPTVLAINEPKAIREPYSDDAFKKPLPVAKPAITKPADDKTAVTATPDATGKATVEPKADVKPELKPETKSDSTSPDDIDWAWPTKGKITANFNEGGGKGMDIAGTTGQTIIAAAAGKVIYSGSDLRGYGKLVIIKHNASYLSVYAHNSQIVVKEGQQVNRGQKIAEMGNTDSNTVKLHFEIRRQGKSVDPSKYLTNN